MSVNAVTECRQYLYIVALEVPDSDHTTAWFASTRVRFASTIVTVEPADAARWRLDAEATLDDSYISAAYELGLRMLVKQGIVRGCSSASSSAPEMLNDYVIDLRTLTPAPFDALMARAEARSVHAALSPSQLVIAVHGGPPIH